MRGLDRRYSPKRKMAQKVLTRGSACNTFEIRVLTTQGLGHRQGVTEYGTPEERTGRKCTGGGCMTQNDNLVAGAELKAFKQLPHLYRVSGGVASSLATPASRKQGLGPHKPCSAQGRGLGVHFRFNFAARMCARLSCCTIFLKPEVVTMLTKENMMTCAGAWP